MLTVLVASLLFGQVDASVVEAPDAGIVYVDAGDYSALVGADGGVVIDAKLDDAAGMVKMFTESVKSGNGWLIAALIVAMLVSLFRTAGKKLHDWLPDNNAIDKVLYYVYDTKIGGWVLNWATSIAGGLLSAISFGWEINGALWLKVLAVSTTASAVFELVRDIWTAIQNLIQKNKEKAAAAAAATPTTPAATETPKS